MKSALLAEIKGSLGFSSSHPEDDESDYMSTGSKNLIIDGQGRIRAFQGVTALAGLGTRVMFPFGATYAGLADSGGNNGKGSVFAGPNLAIVYIGIGDVVLTGTSLATAASTTPALRLLRSGSYTSGGSANGPFTWGLPAPTAGTLAAGVAGSITGTVNLKHSWVRNATGAEGNASIASNVITFASTKANYLITETAPNGADRVRIYPSPRGFGNTGPNYYYSELSVSSFRRTLTDVVTNGTTTITSATASWTSDDVGAHVVLSGGGSLTTTIASVTNSTDVVLNSAPGWSTSGNTAVVNRLIVLDFSDADLKAILAPIDHNVPPVGVWAFQLESAWAVVGCYGDTVTGPTVSAPGNSIAISKTNKYEAFPAEYVLGLPSAPTGMAQRASDAFTYIWGTSWVGACSFTGGTPPMSFQVLWGHCYWSNGKCAGQFYRDLKDK